ncbi:MAG TPA: DUF4270 domain-containing protein [Pedobacter sp.]
MTLLISLFLFSSCKDSSTIGLDVDPANAVQGTLIDTVTVTSRTIADAPASTYSVGNGMSRYPLGSMKDDVFGTTVASLAMSVNLPSGTYAFGKNVAIDSVVLVLPYYLSPAGASTLYTQYRGIEFYGDSTATYNINISQLTDNLSTQSSWLSNKTYAAGDLLGTFSAPIKPTTPVPVVDIVTGAKDTVKTNVPELRIKLNANLIKDKIVNLDSLTLTSNGRFNLAFKGLKVTATTNAKNGGMMFLDFSGGSSNLEIYYKQPNVTTPTQTDTLVALFPIITTTNAVAATVTHDYTNTPVATQLKTPGEYQTTYLQSMSGVSNKITFPYLKNLLAKIGSKIVINKAELVVDSSDPADSIPFKLPPRLALYTTDIAGQRINLPDNNPGSTTNPTGDPRPVASGIPFGGYYDYTKKSYTFVVTDFVQDIISGKIVDNGTYLSVTSASTFNLFPFPTTAGRVAIGSFNNTNNRKIRLNIYYVKTSTVQ